MLNKVITTRLSPFRICDSVKLDNGVTIPIIQGQVSQVGIISQNGYRYREGFWNKVLSNPRVSDALSSRSMLGMIEHPTDDDDYLATPYDKASHVVLKAWVDSAGNPYAHLGLLNNEQGNNLKALAEVGVPIGVSTRGLGSSAHDDVSEYIDEDNYMLLTWDCVKSPNFPDLTMTKVSDSIKSSSLFKEMVGACHLRDSVDDHYSSANLEREVNAIRDELQNTLQRLSRVSQEILRNKQ